MKFLFQHAKAVLFWNVLYPIRRRRYMAAKRNYEKWQTYKDTYRM